MDAGSKAGMTQPPSLWRRPRPARAAIYSRARTIAEPLPENHRATRKLDSGDPGYRSNPELQKTGTARALMNGLLLAHQSCENVRP